MRSKKSRKNNYIVIQCRSILYLHQAVSDSGRARESNEKHREHM